MATAPLALSVMEDRRAWVVVTHVVSVVAFKVLLATSCYRNTNRERDRERQRGRETHTDMSNVSDNGVTQVPVPRLHATSVARDVPMLWHRNSTLGSTAAAAPPVAAAASLVAFSSAASCFLIWLLDGSSFCPASNAARASSCLLRLNNAILPPKYNG